MESEPTKDYDAIERAFLAYKGLAPSVDQPGPEWFTIADFSKRIDKSRRRASEVLNKLAENGLVEFKDFKIFVNDRVTLVRHYRNK